MDSLVQSFHPWLQAKDVTSFNKGTGAVTLPISIKLHEAWVRFFPGWCLVGGGIRLDSWCSNFPNVSQFFRCEACQCMQVSGEGIERVVSPMLKCKLWMRTGSLPVPWLIHCLVLEMSLDHSELHSLWCDLRPRWLRTPSGEPQALLELVSQSRPTLAIQKLQVWGGGGGSSSLWVLALNPQRGCQGEDPDHRRASRAEPDLPDSVKGQRKRVKWEDHVPRVMAMGSFCRKEDNQPCWTQTSLNTDLEEEGGTLQAQKWETSMPGRETAGDGAPAGRAGWGPAQGGPLGTEWGGRGGVQTGFRECWDPQAWEISLAFILRAVGIHSRVAGWRQCEWVNEWIWMNEWSPWKNFL